MKVCLGMQEAGGRVLNPVPPEVAGEWTEIVRDYGLECGPDHVGFLSTTPGALVDVVDPCEPGECAWCDGARAYAIMAGILGAPGARSRVVDAPTGRV